MKFALDCKYCNGKGTILSNKVEIRPTELYVAVTVPIDATCKKCHSYVNLITGEWHQNNNFENQAPVA